MANLETVLNKAWETTPKPRRLDEGEYRLLLFNCWHGYASLDGIMNSGDFAWTLETARMCKTELSYENEWLIEDWRGVKLAESKGLVAMLEKVASNG